MTTGLAIALSGVLGAVALLLIHWGLGGTWPERNAADLARAVIGDGRMSMPPPWTCFGAAVLLLIVAAWPWVMLAHPRSHPVLVAGIVSAAIFFVRGLAGYSSRWRQHFPVEPFVTRDRRWYSPACLLISAALMALLSRGM